MLPYEVDDALPTATAKLLWPVKFLKETLGLQNEAQCREWFAKHPEALRACVDCHRLLEDKIADIQASARRGLETIVAQETLNKYELQPRAELCDDEQVSSRPILQARAPRKRVMDVDVSEATSELVTNLFDNQVGALKDTIQTVGTILAPVISNLILKNQQNQNNKRMRF